MNDYEVPVSHRLHPGYGHAILRAWQSEATLLADHLMYPIFIADDASAMEAIDAMPGQYRWGADRLAEALDEPVTNGLRAVLLFGVPSAGKDAGASRADADDSPVVLALDRLRRAFPDLFLATDVCLCAYTDHGHCCLFHKDGSMDNDATIRRLAEIGVSYARAGAHMVAPSDMMDGRIGAMKHALARAGLDQTPVMSYAAKFSSCFYGPFRDAAHSAPAFGDRRAYQLPPAARGLALRAVDRDIAEGADMVMVKPAGPYLDLVRETRERVTVPVAAYQVSGEYAMLQHAAAAGAFDLRSAVMESLTGIRRAGADCVITYFAPDVLAWLGSSTA
jgi:porphobilinogen synthase